MQTYRRFVSYVYQYENGKKSGNRGFIKVEARGNTCSIQISLKGICRDGNGSCKVYGFKREEGLLKGSLLAECPVKAGVVQEQLSFVRNEMGNAGYSLHDLNGVIFRGDDETMYGTQWDDTPMKMENFQPDVNDLKKETAAKEPEKIERAEQGVRQEDSGQKEEIHREVIEGAEEQEIVAEDPGEEIKIEEEMEAASVQGEIDRREGQETEAIEESLDVQESAEGHQPDIQMEIQGEAGIQEIQETVEESHDVQEETEISQPDIQMEIQEEAVGAVLQEGAGGQESKNKEVEIQEEKRMPPKDLEGLVPDGLDSGKNSAGASSQPQGEKLQAVSPEEKAIPEMPKPKEQQHVGQTTIENGIQREEKSEKPLETGLPEVLDTTVVLPDTQPKAEMSQEEAVEEVGIEEEDIEAASESVPDNADYIRPEVEAENVQEEILQEEILPGEKVFCPFTDGTLEDCQKISMEDIKYLDPRDQGLQNNRFVQHGYQMFGYLLLAKIARNSQYILGVPGIYQKQEKFMADMFGFHNFKCARKNGNQPACFGYWYRLIYPPKLCRRNGGTD